MKISTRARYALRLLIDLADHSGEHEPIVLREVADRQEISKRYLEQLATALKHSDLIATAQGRGGGHTLARRPEDIRVSEIIAASIGPINVVQCVRNPECCPRSADCPSRTMWVRVNDRIDEVFDSVTLADLREGHDEGAVVRRVGSAPCGKSPPAHDSA